MVGNARDIGMNNKIWTSVTYGLSLKWTKSLADMKVYSKSNAKAKAAVYGRVPEKATRSTEQDK